MGLCVIVGVIPQFILCVGNVSHTWLEAVAFDHRLGLLRVVFVGDTAATQETLTHVTVPLPLVPFALFDRFTRTDVQGLRHDPRRHDVVRPDTAVDQATRDGKLFGTVEDLSTDTNRATQVALEMFRLVIDYSVAVARAGIACKQHLLAAFGVRAEEKTSLDCLHSRRIHVAVLVSPPPEENVLLGKILICGVCHSANGVPRVIECKILRIHHDRPQARYPGMVLRFFQTVRNPLNGVEVFRVAGQLGQASEFEIQRTQFSQDSVSTGLDSQTLRRPSK